MMYCYRETSHHINFTLLKPLSEIFFTGWTKLKSAICIDLWFIYSNHIVGIKLTTLVVIDIDFISRCVNYQTCPSTTDH
jgi:hypothetical protein